MSLDHSHCGLAAHKTCAQKTTWEPKFQPGFTPNKNFQYLRKELQVVNFGSRLWHQDCTRINQLDRKTSLLLDTRPILIFHLGETPSYPNSHWHPKTCNLRVCPWVSLRAAHQSSEPKIFHPWQARSGPCSGTSSPYP